MVRTQQRTRLFEPLVHGKYARLIGTSDAREPIADVHDCKVFLAAMYAINR